MLHVATELDPSAVVSTVASTTTEHPETVRRRTHREKGERAAREHSQSESQSDVVEQNEERSAHESSDFDDLYAEDEEADSPNVTQCKKYAQPMADWMKKNPGKWSGFLSKTEFPVLPDYGKVVYGGCRGFAKGIMSWPQDLIIGGAQEGNNQIKSAEALQSVFLVASPNDLFLRFKDGVRKHLKPSLNAALWNMTTAEEVIRTWQRNFTHNLYNHEWNFERDAEGNVASEHRRVHPLASTSIADMLEEFCQFNYTIIFVGYLLMLAYALQAQMRHHGCMLTADSCVGLAFAGVLTVTFASIAGLGLATWFGIEFNAATTQIVPFLTLGIGVDNMFLLLHNYHGVVESVKEDEVGNLMKETGMSVLMTSINNILSFLAGTLLPIPALRGFCAQSSILLTFNLVAILTIYPAIISLDLRRRKSTRRDVCCCVVADESLISDDGYTLGIGVKPHLQEKRTVGDSVPSYHNLYSRNEKEDDVEDDVKPWTLHAFLRHYYIPFLKRGTTKVFILLVCVCFLVAGLLGMHRASYGLELSDVLPEHTAPAAFLKARDRYFSFYPMFAVLKGPNIDYAKDQHKIDNYRRSIAKCTFWQIWLLGFQINVTSGLVMGEKADFVGLSNKLSAAVNIAYRLTCSFGHKYDCSGRIGKVRLVDESGTINVDGFYNYVTAWYNSDSMMYHVSQASFFPPPPHWSYEDSSAPLFVPPAVPFAYSQIPFYLTGLTDTPIIVEMIKEIRAVCDKFANEGLPNFPSGIAFTFWEQYLHLSSNLLQAICVIAFAVFFVISLIICNPWAAGVIMIILVLMTIELAGFLGLAGIKLNPVSAVTIITAVGIGVEFTAHVVLAFLTSLGTRERRMVAAVDRVFVPVIHGAFSTLLGIIMLAFSEFEFVVKYFFVVMSALIAIGVVNGLALLPVLLSLIGPPCEAQMGVLTPLIAIGVVNGLALLPVLLSLIGPPCEVRTFSITGYWEKRDHFHADPVFPLNPSRDLMRNELVNPVDGTDRLAPPPALRRKDNKRHIQEMQTHRRNDSDDSNTGTLGPENCSTMLLIEPPRDSSSGSGPRLVANTHARSASAHITV
ncbi:Protein patched -like protein 1 [Toxocara canis]|uniref:Protein patched-like protein 1 n=1 Tax=Toxocara canis TaxID=6265 RepID=A0A0B2UQR3_TOXCA|nr:Protein patched -like protein 1 [Toxocara canis]